MFSSEWFRLDKNDMFGHAYVTIRKGFLVLKNGAI